MLHLVLSVLMHAAAEIPAAIVPGAQAHPIAYTTPATTWDEALPLGNGTLGALVWGDGEPLKISLDHTGLWDLRPVPEFHSPEYNYATMREWERQGRYEDLIRLYEAPYNRPAPTKIPAGRIELDVASPGFESARLDIAAAKAQMALGAGAQASVWVHATEPVGIIEVSGVQQLQARLVAPKFGGKEKTDDTPAISAGELANLGYPAPVKSSGESWQAYEQEGYGGFRFAVYCGWRAQPDGALRAAWSVATSNEGQEPIAVARQRVENALGERYALLEESHVAWWSTYWRKGWVDLPDENLERQWYWDMYKFGAASRYGAPPITLQGPWTADDGKLPPWKGDYHHDLNTELSYWPAYTGNRLTEGMNFLDWLWATKENCEGWTKRFFGMPGLNVPMTADLLNNQIGGWRQYTHSATIGAWLSHHFYLHWRYTLDRKFLEERAYPYLAAVSTFLEAITNERDANGRRTLPLSSSPEIHDNKPEAWFPGMTNYDNALIRFAFSKSAELAIELNNTAEADRWNAALSEMPDLAVDDDAALLVAPEHPLKESHRHLSHLMAIHPLSLLDISQGEKAERTVQASLAHLRSLGTSQWTGYSFAWLGNLAARARDGEAAADALRTFADAFVLRNSFHCNGDQSGTGISNFTYRPFTLEGNFASAAGVCEMLLQSHAGIVDIFPAVPDSWSDASFHYLRAQGGFVVSAVRQGGVVVQAEIIASVAGPVKVRIDGVEDIHEDTLARGQTLRYASGAFEKLPMP